MDNLTPAKNKSLVNFLLISLVIIILLGIVILVAAVYLRNSNATVNTINSNVENQQQTSQVVSSTVEAPKPKAELNRVFVGTFVTATIPVNWNIVEYTNFKGMSENTITENIDFSGLTGLEIFNDSGDVVFSFRGIDGIGGGYGCSSVVRFKDTDAQYIQNIIDETELTEMGSTTVIDKTKATYSEINALNLRFRRVENKMYVAKNFSTSFNTACGIEEQFVKIDELQFNGVQDGVKYSSNAYKFGINSSIMNESTFQKLDEVLNTLKAKSAS
jgi:hypothetical protein